MSKITTNKRTLDALRKQGYQAEVTQIRITRFGAKPGEPASITRDLAGFADVLAWHPGLGKILIVQATTQAQVTNHIRKYRRDPKVANSILDWLAAGGLLQIWGWRQGTGGKWEYIVKSIWPNDMILTASDEKAMAKEKP